jgi:hypothetical protein
LAPWVKPSVFPRLGVLALLIVLLVAQQPWVGAFSRKVMELNFVLEQDIAPSSRSFPQNISIPTQKVGAPNIPRARGFVCLFTQACHDGLGLGLFEDVGAGQAQARQYRHHLMCVVVFPAERSGRGKP